MRAREGAEWAPGLDRVGTLIADGGDVRMEGDDLVVSPDASLTKAAGCSRVR